MIIFCVTYIFCSETQEQLAHEISAIRLYTEKMLSAIKSRMIPFVPFLR